MRPVDHCFSRSDQNNDLRHYLRVALASYGAVPVSVSGSKMSTEPAFPPKCLCHHQAAGSIRRMLSQNVVLPFGLASVTIL